MEINRYLDHAVLKPELSAAEAQAAVELGLKHNVRTVCVRPIDIAMAKSLCAGTDTAVITVLSFPHGLNTTATKAFEARQFADMGVTEIDMVANYSFIRSGMWDLVEKDIKAVTDVANPAGIGVKVIFEANMLTDEEIRLATLTSIKANAAFVKTSTGFNGPGATEQAVRIMLDAAEGRIKVKPSGGIRNYAQAVNFIKMGAERLGVGYSSTEAICAGSGEGTGY